MKFQPLGDRVLVSVVTPSQEKTGSLFIPDSIRSRTPEAIVQAVGDSVNNDRPIYACVSKGDHVLLAELSGVEIRIEGEAFRVVNIEDILGVIR